MRIQKTFEGEMAIDNALDYVSHLSRCFIIKGAKIIKLKQKHKWRGEKYQLKVKYQ